MDYRTFYAQTRKMKTVLKFDTGADGFKRMMFLLGALSVLILLVGIYFITVVIHDLKLMP